MYAFAKSVALILLPPSGPLLVVFAGLALGAKRPRLGRAVALLGATSLWLASTPLAVSLLILDFGSEHPINIEEAKHAQAIVILAGGLRRAAPEYGGNTVGRLTLERVRYGATLARQTGLPILVTGGAPPRATRSEAELMQSALKVEFGIQPRWVEKQSSNTRENAVKSAALLRQDGVQRVVLVAHAFDMPRARRRFEQAGIEVISAPTHVPTTPPWDVQSFVPNPNAMSDCFYLGYEALASIADRFLPGR